MPTKKKDGSISNLVKRFLGLKTKNDQKDRVTSARFNPIAQPMSTQAGRGNMATEHAVASHQKNGHKIDNRNARSDGKNSLNPVVSIEHEENRNIVSRRKMAERAKASKANIGGAGAHLDTTCKSNRANIKQMAKATNRISIGMVGSNTVPPKAGDKEVIYRAQDKKGKFVAYKPDGTPANAKDLKKAGFTLNNKGNAIAVNDRVVSGVTKGAKANAAGTSKTQKTKTPRKKSGFVSSLFFNDHNSPEQKPKKKTSAKTPPGKKKTDTNTKDTALKPSGGIRKKGADTNPKNDSANRTGTSKGKNPEAKVPGTSKKPTAKKPSTSKKPSTNKKTSASKGKRPKL